MQMASRWQLLGHQLQHEGIHKLRMREPARMLPVELGLHLLHLCRHQPWHRAGAQTQPAFGLRCYHLVNIKRHTEQQLLPATSSQHLSKVDVNNSPTVDQMTHALSTSCIDLAIALTRVSVSTASCCASCCRLCACFRLNPSNSIPLHSTPSLTSPTTSHTCAAAAL